jgi:hypothetical protein
MDDEQIMQRISALIDEEHSLERAHEGEPLSADGKARLDSLEVALDQCWDLLRQRRARRNAGEDADGAKARPDQVVEGYQQ